MADLVLVRMTAIFGDGSENYYRGPDTPKVREVIRDLNDHNGDDGPWSGIAEVVTPGEVPAEGETCDCDSEQRLIDSIVWWCNNCPNDRCEYEFVPNHARRVTSG